MFSDKEILAFETCLLLVVPLSVGLAAVSALLFAR